MAQTPADAITWFEISARDLARAQRFYEALLGAPLERETMGAATFAVFPHDRKAGVGGCVLAGDGTPVPGASGTTVYLAVDAIDAALARATNAGGAVTTPKTALPGDMGFYAVITDSEGNRVGLHAMK